LKVQSDVGRGATFVFSIPLGKDHFRSDIIDRRQKQVSEHPKRRAEDLAADLTPSRTPTIGTVVASLTRADFNQPIVLDSGRKPRILVVEDEDDLRQFIANVLSTQFEVTVAADGAKGLELVQ